MDNVEKFNNRELPTEDQFYSILNDEHITDDEYIHAKEVWDTFYIKTMGEYHDLYLVSDVLLLTDVFEKKDVHAMLQIRSMSLFHKSGS